MKKYGMLFANEKEKAEWLKAIKNAISSLQEQAAEYERRERKKERERKREREKEREREKNFFFRLFLVPNLFAFSLSYFVSSFNQE